MIWIFSEFDKEIRLNNLSNDPGGAFVHQIFETKI